MEPIKINLPKLEFKKECPVCKQKWLTYNGDICPDCEAGIKTLPQGKPKEVVIKPEPDPIVGENDAIEDVQGDLGYGK